jgi:hypothetical protein
MTEKEELSRMLLRFKHGTAIWYQIIVIYPVTHLNEF